jgi:PGF-pre-PGF domain-containing protein/PGF-CTERM protein
MLKPLRNRPGITSALLSVIIILSLVSLSSPAGAVDATLKTNQGTYAQGSTLVVNAEVDLQNTENVPINTLTYDIGNGNSVDFDVDGNVVGSKPNWLISVSRTTNNAGYEYGYGYSYDPSTGSSYNYGYGYGYTDGSGSSPTLKYKIKIDTAALQQQSYSATLDINAGQQTFDSNSVSLTIERPGKAQAKSSANGDLDLDLGNADVSRVQFKNLPANADVKVSTSQNPTGGAPTVANRQVATYMDIEVVGQTVQNSVTVSTTVKKSTLNNNNIDLEDARIAHHTNGQWDIRSTSYTDNNDGTVTLTATVSSFSPFAVVGSESSSGGGGGGDGIDYSQITTAEPVNTPDSTTTPTSTSTAEPVTTDEPTEMTDEPTDASSDDSTAESSGSEGGSATENPEEPQTTAETTPGFGAVVAMLALLGAALLATRRRSE